MKLFGFHIISDSAYKDEIKNIEAGCSRIQAECDKALRELDRKKAEIESLKNWQMHDSYYSKALETIRKQQDEIAKLKVQIINLDHTLDESLARRDELARQVERMAKTEKPVIHLVMRDGETRNKSCHFYMKPSLYKAINRLAKSKGETMSGMLENILTDKLTGGK